MTFMHASENKAFRLVVIFLMIFALALTVARPARAVAVTSILIPAVIATLGAWGIGTAAEGLDGDAIAEWFHDKLTSWETAAQISLANIATGIKMTPLGQVLLNPFALAGIREFGAWLIQQEGLVAGGVSVPVVSPDPTFNNYPMYNSVTINQRSNLNPFKIVAFGVSLCIIATSREYTIYGFSSTAGSAATLEVYNTTSGSTSIQTSTRDLWQHSGSTYYAAIWSSSTSNVVSVEPSLADFTLSDVLGSSGGEQSGDGSLALVPSTEMDVPTAADVQDKELLLNTSLDVGADAAAWYESVMSKVAANDMTVTGTLTQAGTITADQVLDQGAIREEDGVVMWPDVVQPIGVTGLEDIFPFCIPFDIYHFCQALAAEPVAPSFDVPFRIEGIVDYTFHLDLEDFDQVAALLRTLELLLFCVGLAFVTRSMFIRG